MDARLKKDAADTMARIVDDDDDDDDYSNKLDLTSMKSFRSAGCFETLVPFRTQYHSFVAFSL